MTDFKKQCYWLWLLAACCLLFSSLNVRADDLENLISRQSATSSYTSSREISSREADDLIMNAMSLIGVGYRWGGTSPSTGMDCSGFMQYIFRKSMNINLPRTSSEMAQIGTQISRSALQVGDMVFFNTRGFSNSHVGIYVGNGMFVHAPNSRSRVRFDTLESGYWKTKFTGVRRVSGAPASKSAFYDNMPKGM